MCFGGGGGGQQQAPAPINIMPQTPIIKQPEAPKQLTQQYTPLQQQTYQPGVQQAGASQRRQTQSADTGASMARRRGLSAGLAVARGGSTTPRGGINL